MKQTRTSLNETDMSISRKKSCEFHLKSEMLRRGSSRGRRESNLKIFFKNILFGRKKLKKQQSLNEEERRSFKFLKQQVNRRTKKINVKSKFGMILDSIDSDNKENQNRKTIHNLNQKRVQSVLDYEIKNQQYQLKKLDHSMSQQLYLHVKIKKFLRQFQTIEKHEKKDLESRMKIDQEYLMSMFSHVKKFQEKRKFIMEQCSQRVNQLSIIKNQIKQKSIQNQRLRSKLQELRQKKFNLELAQKMYQEIKKEHQEMRAKKQKENQEFKEIEMSLMKKYERVSRQILESLVLDIFSSQSQNQKIQKLILEINKIKSIQKVQFQIGKFQINYCPKPQRVLPCLLRAQTTSMAVTVLLLACSVQVIESLTTSPKNFSRTSLISLQIPKEILLTPPLLASLLIAGLVTPSMADLCLLPDPTLFLELIFPYDFPDFPAFPAIIILFFIFDFYTQKCPFSTYLQFYWPIFQNQCFSLKDFLINPYQRFCFQINNQLMKISFIFLCLVSGMRQQMSFPLEMIYRDIVKISYAEYLIQEKAYDIMEFLRVHDVLDQLEQQKKEKKKEHNFFTEEGTLNNINKAQGRFQKGMNKIFNGITSRKKKRSRELNLDFLTDFDKEFSQDEKEEHIAKFESTNKESLFKAIYRQLNPLCYSLEKMPYYLQKTRCVMKVLRKSAMGFDFELKYGFSPYAPEAIYLTVDKGYIDYYRYFWREIQIEQYKQGLKKLYWNDPGRMQQELKKYEMQLFGEKYMQYHSYMMFKYAMGGGKMQKAITVAEDPFFIIPQKIGDIDIKMFHQRPILREIFTLVQMNDPKLAMFRVINVMKDRLLLTNIFNKNQGRNFFNMFYRIIERKTDQIRPNPQMWYMQSFMYQHARKLAQVDKVSKPKMERRLNLRQKTLIKTALTKKSRLDQILFLKNLMRKVKNKQNETHLHLNRQKLQKYAKKQYQKHLQKNLQKKSKNKRNLHVFNTMNRGYLQQMRFVEDVAIILTLRQQSVLDIDRIKNFIRAQNLMNFNDFFPKNMPVPDLKKEDDSCEDKLDELQKLLEEERNKNEMLRNQQKPQIMNQQPKNPPKQLPPPKKIPQDSGFSDIPVKSEQKEESVEEQNQQQQQQGYYSSNSKSSSSSSSSSEDDLEVKKEKIEPSQVVVQNSYQKSQQPEKQEKIEKKEEQKQPIPNSEVVVELKNQKEVQQQQEQDNGDYMVFQIDNDDNNDAYYEPEEKLEPHMGAVNMNNYQSIFKQQIIQNVSISNYNNLRNLEELSTLSNLSQLSSLSELKIKGVDTSSFKKLEKLKNLEKLQDISKIKHITDKDNLQVFHQFYVLQNLHYLSYLSVLSELSKSSEPSLHKLSELSKLKDLEKLKNLDQLKILEKAPQNSDTHHLQQAMENNQDPQITMKFRALEQVKHFGKMSEMADLKVLENLKKVKDEDDIPKLKELHLLTHLHDLSQLDHLVLIKDLGDFYEHKEEYQMDSDYCETCNQKQDSENSEDDLSEDEEELKDFSHAAFKIKDIQNQEIQQQQKECPKESEEFEKLGDQIEEEIPKQGMCLDNEESDEECEMEEEEKQCDADQNITQAPTCNKEAEGKKEETEICDKDDENNEDEKNSQKNQNQEIDEKQCDADESPENDINDKNNKNDSDYDEFIQKYCDMIESERDSDINYCTFPQSNIKYECFCEDKQDESELEETEQEVSQLKESDEGDDVQQVHKQYIDQGNQQSKNSQDGLYKKQQFKRQLNNQLLQSALLDIAKKERMNRMLKRKRRIGRKLGLYMIQFK